MLVMNYIYTDKGLDQGQQWLERLLNLAKIPAKVIARQQEDSYWLTIDETNLTPEQVSVLVGVDGKVIDAIQYLTNTILNISNDNYEQHLAYTVEIGGYRARRQEELLLMAEYAAKKVRLTRQDYELTSLSSTERRQIHTMLKDCEDLETYSHGQEPDRRLVVRIRN
ncbi:MAG: RNA-binding protein [Trichodesmium sp. St15_bin1_1]|jgi:Predicted RNA-binding protein|nr:RNA-binding protein [Trichodesmium sp. St5_bin2_1]MDE5080706.1 RNA-binding protein [Trichodesmium sp. St18_bin1]MDE5106309.1 RNA-binding protein [Trichodesmium sp. St17_bin3_1_1]MDE5111568.1 RNA-binding protein [Trichodesmium sp. St7_bin2_1]MDE5115163.1 RNA-binding protein [Trichodesmium sp. St15_bin1_1]MDE5116199.1 RNA-binding protein [Trichodesmium sp. St2_bin2_1]MDE5122514.1 RNA-binding protein [Trichodesmium sp. St19_bin1]